MIDVEDAQDTQKNDVDALSSDDCAIIHAVLVPAIPDLLLQLDFSTDKTIRTLYLVARSFILCT
jgi:hypothetical protein